MSSSIRFKGKKLENVKIIVSLHNYQNTPSVEEIGVLVTRIQATRVDIVKIATTALDIMDCRRVFQILVHSQVSDLSQYFVIFNILDFFQQIIALRSEYHIPFS